VILGGFTDNADESANCVWMLNGSTEVLREGRQLDIDNDGTLDDAFVSMRGDTASPEGLGGFLTDAGELYTNVQLVDGTGTEIGQAFLRLTMAADCPGDLDGSGDVGTTDLLQLLAAWGPCDDCDEDLDGSGEVGTTDLLELLAAWGPC